jgi:hypothetical protein
VSAAYRIWFSALALDPASHNRAAFLKLSAVGMIPAASSFWGVAR